MIYYSPQYTHHSCDLQMFFNIEGQLDKKHGPPIVFGMHHLTRHYQTCKT